MHKQSVYVRIRSREGYMDPESEVHVPHTPQSHGHW